jgi:hypothetical protein
MEHGYQLATGKSAAEEGTLTAMANLQSADRTIEQTPLSLASLAPPS